MFWMSQPFKSLTFTEKLSVAYFNFNSKLCSLIQYTKIVKQSFTQTFFGLIQKIWNKIFSFIFIFDIMVSTILGKNNFWPTLSCNIPGLFELSSIKSSKITLFIGFSKEFKLTGSTNVFSYGFSVTTSFSSENYLLYC